MKVSQTLALAAAMLFQTMASAQEYTFGLDPKHVVITFESQMEVEDILGTTHRLSGTASFSPTEGSFHFEVPVDSLQTGIDLRDQHLRSETWLDAKRFPVIRFEGRDIRAVGDTKVRASGTFTMHGVSKPLLVTVEVRRIPSDQATKMGLGEGEWVRVRGEFSVQLSDFGILIPGMAAAKVNDVWTVKVSLFGKAAHR